MVRAPGRVTYVPVANDFKNLIRVYLLISFYHCPVIVLVTNVPLLNLLSTLNKVLFYSLFYSRVRNPAGSNADEMS